MHYKKYFYEQLLSLRPKYLNIRSFSGLVKKLNHYFTVKIRQPPTKHKRVPLGLYNWFRWMELYINNAMLDTRLII